jgi:hypothetical protein
MDDRSENAIAPPSVEKNNLPQNICFPKINGRKHNPFFTQCFILINRIYSPIIPPFVVARFNLLPSI